MRRDSMMIANATDNVVVGVGGGIFVMIGAAVVRWRNRIAPRMQTNFLFDTRERVASFLRFWGYGAMTMGAIGFGSMIVWVFRRA
jgi:hypothetical protein